MGTIMPDMEICRHCDQPSRWPCTTEYEQCSLYLNKVDLSEAPDQGTSPNYYTRFPVQPSYFIIRNKLPFWAGNVVKYVCRYDAKNGLKDLKKARRYLDMQIKLMEGDEETFHVAD